MTYTSTLFSSRFQPDRQLSVGDSGTSTQASGTTVLHHNGIIPARSTRHPCFTCHHKDREIRAAERQGTSKILYHLSPQSNVDRPYRGWRNNSNLCHHCGNILRWGQVIQWI